MCYIINCCLSSTVHFYFNALFTLEEAQGFTLQKVRKTQIHTLSEERVALPRTVVGAPAPMVHVCALQAE